MLVEFLKRKASAIGLFILFSLFVGGWFFFNDLDMNALGYPLVTTVIVGICLLIVSYRKTLSKHKQLTGLVDFVNVTDELPEASTIIEQDLTELIGRLDRVYQTTLTDFNDHTKATDDYYTMWVHQIKTPIAAMKLKLDKMDSEDAAALKSQLLRIEQYAEMVLIYRRLEFTETDYRFAEVELDDIVKEAVRKFRTEFINKHINLRYEIEPMTILTDEKWLTFVIEQLLSNSLKYTGKGYIRIYVDDLGRLSVEDSGIGIMEEDIPRIFEKGFTGRNGRMDKRASGIGLYLCKRICDNLSSEITVESKLGVGSTVRVSLNRPDRVYE